MDKKFEYALSMAMAICWMVGVSKFGFVDIGGRAE